MAKRKKQLRRKNELKGKAKTNRKRKIKVSKGKQKRVKIHRGTSKKKVSVDSKFWNKRKRSAKHDSRAVYTTRSLLSGHKGRSGNKKSSSFFPKINTKFKIKKKLKMTVPLSVDNTLDKKLLIKQAKAYLIKKNKMPKGAYIKIVMRDSSGGLRFLSHKRIKVKSEKTIDYIWNKIFDKIRSQYGGASIIGYEIEEVTDIEEQ